MMKKLIDIAIILFFFSCSTREKPNTSNNTKLTDTLVSFSGYWLSENYYNSIKEFKSPRKAQEGSTFLYIPDTLGLPNITRIISFHMGDDKLKIVKKANKYYLYKYYAAGIAPYNEEIKNVSSTKITIGGKNFIKISPVKTNEGELILEEILFKGHYVTKEGKEIEFKTNGQIIGLDSFEYYSPLIDYFDAGLDVDQIKLGKTENKMDKFGFKFFGDTLEINKLNCIDYDSVYKTCNQVALGKIVYRLIKKK